MNFVFRKDSGKSPKNSLKVAFCACKWKFGSITVHCSNSVMHELWTLSCASNERREAYLSIHVHLIKQIYDYDSKKLQWNSVSFILGRTVVLPGGGHTWFWWQSGIRNSTIEHYHAVKSPNIALSLNLTEVDKLWQNPQFCCSSGSFSF